MAKTQKKTKAQVAKKRSARPPGRERPAKDGPAAGCPRQARTGEDAVDCRHEGGAHRGRGQRRRERGQVRLLHHQKRDPARFRSARNRRGPGRGSHRELPRHRRRRVEYADGRPGSDARQRPGPPARQRNGDAEAHRHPDVVRHGVQDRRRHHGAAAVGVRRVYRRPQQDAGQVRVRPEGALGSRSDHPGDRGRGRGHHGGSRGRSRRRRVPPTSRGCSMAG